MKCLVLFYIASVVIILVIHTMDISPVLVELINGKWLLK